MLGPRLEHSEPSNISWMSEWVSFPHWKWFSVVNFWLCWHGAELFALFHNSLISTLPTHFGLALWKSFFFFLPGLMFLLFFRMEPSYTFSDQSSAKSMKSHWNVSQNMSGFHIHQHSVNMHPVNLCPFRTLPIYSGGIDHPSEVICACGQT